MDLRFLISTAFLLLAAVGVAAASHASLLPAETYWHKVLPNVPMPGAILDLLHPGRLGIDTSEDTSSKDGDEQYGKNSASINKYYYYGKNSASINKYYYYGKNSANINKYYYYGKNSANINKYYYYGKNSANINKYYYYGKNAANINKFHNDQFHNDPRMSLFFLEKDLQPGATKSLHFVRNFVRSTFVHRREAESIPFSSSKLPEILDHFSVKNDSSEAVAIETALTACEMPHIEGEHKFCATSLESLAESSMSALNSREVQAVSTSLSKEGTPKQAYTIAASGLRRLPGSEAVACHPLVYPYAVYYCHTMTGTKAYRIALTGKDGTKVDGVVVCHMETAAWNPEQVAFLALGVKPGAVVCHILAPEAMLWIPRK